MNCEPADEEDPVVVKNVSRIDSTVVWKSLVLIRFNRSVKTMFRISLILLCFSMLCVPATAAVIIQVQNASITAGGTGFVDVLISSSAASELLSTTGFVFEISGSPNLTGELEFLAEPDPVNFSPPSYVFGAATLNYFDSLPTSTEISGGDWFELGDTNVTITAATQTLARFNLLHTAIGDPALAVGSTFTIGLKPLAAHDFSFWDDSDSDPLLHGPVSLDIDASSFTNIGTITITSAAVPEPSTFAIMAMVAAGVAGRKLRRRKGHADGDREATDAVLNL